MSAPGNNADAKLLASLSDQQRNALAYAARHPGDHLMIGGRDPGAWTRHSLTALHRRGLLRENHEVGRNNSFTINATGLRVAALMGVS